MTRLFRMLAAMLAALGIIGIAANTVHASDTQVPFVGSYSGTASFTDDPYVRLLDGTGFSTHLGLGTNHGRVVITGLDNSCSGGIANVNYETLIAANGDTLSLASDDVACPVGQGVYHGTGEWFVTGGTGRFSGASGQGTLDGQVDWVHLVFTINLTGTISAPD